jgi:hypothetical protein
MADEPQQAKIVDPDRIAETLCDGQFNIHTQGAFAHLTFTHHRPAAAPLFAGRLEFEAVVRARVVTSIDNLKALRDLLNRLIQEPDTATAASDSTKH